MPPSGFDQESVTPIVNFYARIVELLDKEVVRGKHTSFQAGIEFEIGHITKALNGPVLTDNVLGILLLTRGFYASVLKKLHEGIPKETAVKQACNETSKELLAIHINQAGKLVEQPVE